MIGKVAGAVVVSGALALGTGGAALASTTGTSSAGTSSPGTSPGAGQHGCALAPTALAHLQRVDARITKALPRLEAMETKMAGSGHPKVAARLSTRVKRLENRQQRITARIARIEKRCPDATPTAPSSSGGSSAAGGPSGNGGSSA